MLVIARFLFDSAASCVMMIVRWMVHVWHTTVVYHMAYHVRKGLPGTLHIKHQTSNINIKISLITFLFLLSPVAEQRRDARIKGLHRSIISHFIESSLSYIILYSSRWQDERGGRIQKIFMCSC